MERQEDTQRFVGYFRDPICRQLGQCSHLVAFHAGINLGLVLDRFSIIDDSTGPVFEHVGFWDTTDEVGGP